jgi:prolyl-tRNA synthetase
MRLSKTFIKTLREAPKDETAKNGAYLIRAGYIHKEMAGVYDYLPLGLRVIDNIKTIVREELNRIGCEELSLTTYRIQSLGRRPVDFRTRKSISGSKPS